VAAGDAMLNAAISESVALLIMVFLRRFTQKRHAMLFGDEEMCSMQVILN
jgi:hypothetical protein